MGGEEFAFVNMIGEGSMRLGSDGSVTFTVLDIGSLPEDVSESLDYNIELIDDLLEEKTHKLSKKNKGVELTENGKQ